MLHQGSVACQEGGSGKGKARVLHACKQHTPRSNPTDGHQLCYLTIICPSQQRMSRECFWTILLYAHMWRLTSIWEAGR